MDTKLLLMMIMMMMMYARVFAIISVYSPPIPKRISRGSESTAHTSVRERLFRDGKPLMKIMVMPVLACVRYTIAGLRPIPYNTNLWSRVTRFTIVHRMTINNS